MQRMDSHNNGNQIITEFSLTCCDSWLGLKAEENTVHIKYFFYYHYF